MAKQKYLTKAVRLPDGTRKYVRGHTQKELDKKVAALQMEIGLGIDVDNDTLFQDYAEQWFKTEKSTHLTDGTKRNYERFLRIHIYPFIGDMKLRDIKASHIRELLFKASDMSRKSQGVILNILRSVFDMAVDDDIIIRSPVSPKIKPKGAPSEEVLPLTPEQEDALLKAAEGLRVYPIVFTLLRTGMRRGEVTALMWQDIDFEANEIHIRRHAVPDRSSRPVIVEGAKTDCGVRDIPMPEDLKQYLRSRMAKARSVYVFPNSKGQVCSHAALAALWGTLNAHAGFRTHPHQLRHTYCTKLFEAGLDIKQVQYVMGHSDPGITLKIYTHYRESVRKQETIQMVRAAFG